MKNRTLFIFLLATAILAVSCKPDEPQPTLPPQVDTVVVTDTIHVPVHDTIPADTIPSDPSDTLFPSTGGAGEGLGPLSCVQPPYLKAGDTIALISPSYYTPMTTIQSAANVLRGWGLVPLLGPNTDKQVDGKYGGTIAQRAGDVRWAVNNPNIKAIMCTRGGYGSIHLINDLHLDEITASPKWIIGYSDISTLHGLWSCAGVMSIHGTMATFLPSGSTGINCTLVRDLLFGKVPRYELPVHAQNIRGHAEGTLVGGNVCTFAPNVGTQADATRYDSLILFIEEVGESMHNVDRQVRILELNGVLDRCRGVILGEFTNCGTDLAYANCEAMLRKVFEPYRIPVLCGFPAGHGNLNLPLVMGAHVTIDVRSDGATVHFDIDGQEQVINTATLQAPDRLSPDALSPDHLSPDHLTLDQLSRLSPDHLTLDQRLRLSGKKE